MQSRSQFANSRHGTGSAEPPSLTRTILLALALFALALPIVGPLDDHHFAERSHTHGHIYPDGRPVQHRHLDEYGPGHWHAGQRGLATYGDGWRQRDGVAYFTDATASLMLAVLNAPYHPAPDRLRPPAAHIKGDNPLSGFAARYARPEGQNVAPPLPPPIA